MSELRVGMTVTVDCKYKHQHGEVCRYQGRTGKILQQWPNADEWFVDIDGLDPIFEAADLVPVADVTS